jgi:hypothetical protein
VPQADISSVRRCGAQQEQDQSNTQHAARSI